MPRGVPATLRQKIAGRKNLMKAHILRRGRPRGTYTKGPKLGIPRR